MADDDPQRRSNWKDAGALEIPQCPACGAMNRPGVQYVERVGRVFVCSVCAVEFGPVEPPR